MPLIYALVARSTHVLAEYTVTGITGNFSTVTRVLLKKISSQDAKMSYLYDKYVFHYIVEDELIYLCMSDRYFEREIAFQFLDYINKKFVATYGDRGKTAIAFAFNIDFQRVLQQQMDRFNALSQKPREEDGVPLSTADSDIKFNKLKQGVKDLHEVMVDNLEKVIDRSDRIELLVTKSGEISDSARGFHDRSTNLKRTFWWKNAKIVIIVIIALIILILIIVAASCGGLNCNK